MSDGEATKRKMPEGRRFQPGQSGNPNGGRAHRRVVASRYTIEQLQAKIRDVVPEAIEALAKIATDETVSPRDRVAAAGLLLDKTIPDAKAEEAPEGDDAFSEFIETVKATQTVG